MVLKLDRLFSLQRELKAHLQRMTVQVAFVFFLQLLEAAQGPVPIG